MNSNYINLGMVRFINAAHGYGKGEKSGAMVGYVENMEWDQVYSEVNYAATLTMVANLSQSQIKWIDNDINRLYSEIIRAFRVSPFHLYHFWIDLRDKKHEASLDCFLHPVQ